MEFVNGEYLSKIENSVARNVSCCKYAMDSKKRVGILARGEYNTGLVSRVWWDDMEDIDIARLKKMKLIPKLR